MIYGFDQHPPISSMRYCLHHDSRLYRYIFRPSNSSWVTVNVGALPPGSGFEQLNEVSEKFSDVRACTFRMFHSQYILSMHQGPRRPQLPLSSHASHGSRPPSDPSPLKDPPEPLPPPIAAVAANHIPSSSPPGRQQPLLSEADFEGIEEAWISFWSEAGFGTPKELNRLLARSMREQTAGDPWALDMARQDGKDFL